MARRKANQKIRPEDAYDSYPIRILDWSAQYSFHLNRDKFFGDGPYSEHPTLEIEGEFLAPKKVQGRKLTIALLAKREITQELSATEWEDWEPKAIGGLGKLGKTRDVHDK